MCGINGILGSYNNPTEQIEKMSVDEINEVLNREFEYDDFKWQLENKGEVNEPNRADGLHRVLYKCPICGEEHSMTSSGSKLKCTHCNTEWEMNKYGQLISDKKTFTHIPDWYEWERECVRKEVEAGTYSTTMLDCTVDSIPDDKFVHLGKGKMIHDMNGFKVEGVDFDGDKFEMIKEVMSLYSCHVEYNYLFTHGDCVDLNTLEDTWYCYPEGKFAVTKMALATEELYFNYMKKIGNKLPKGMA